MEVPNGDSIAQCVDPQGAMFAVHARKKIAGTRLQASRLLGKIFEHEVEDSACSQSLKPSSR